MKTAKAIGPRVGVPEVDSEHDAIVRSLEELRGAMAAGGDSSRVQAAIYELMQRTGANFRTEERMMRSSGYSGYDWHKRQHEAARKRLQAYADRAEAGDGEAVTEMTRFVASWLGDHTSLHDRMMGAFLRNFSRARAVKPS